MTSTTIYIDATNEDEVAAMKELLKQYPDAKVWTVPRGSIRPEWEPGNLGTQQLTGLLIDCLADLWRDCYRRENPTHQRKVFAEIVHDAIYCSTGETIAVGGR